MSLQVNLHSLDNAGADQKKFAKAAVDRLRSVVDDKDFRKKVGSARYSGRRRRTDTGTFDDNTTNETIVEIIFGGKERREKPDQEINLKVKPGRLDDDVLGSWDPDTPLFFTTNTKFFSRWLKKNDSLSLAAHWMHEWMHVAGLRHTKGVSNTIKRKDVPYTLGKIVVSIGQRIAKNTRETSVDSISEMGRDYLEASENDNCSVYEDD